MFKRFDNEFAGCTNYPLHKGYPAPDLLPHRGKFPLVAQYLAGKCITFCQGWIEPGPDAKKSPRGCCFNNFGTRIDGCDGCCNGNPFDPVLNLHLPTRTNLDLVIFAEDAPYKRSPDDASFHVLPVAAGFVHIE